MTINLHFFRSSNGERNFGDELSPLFVSLLTSQHVSWSNVSECDLISLGSIFEGTSKRLIHRKLRMNTRPIHVWGTGFIDSNPINHKKYLNNYKFHAVRGSLSKNKLELKDVTLGDPGLLSKHLISPQKKRISTLLVPHVAHREHKVVEHLKKTIKNCSVADLTQDPIEILKLISSADRVISSSLHGLICADSLGIKNIRLNLEGGLKGGDYKFNDYNSAIQRPNFEIKGREVESSIYQAIEEVDFAYMDNIDNACMALHKAFPSELK